MFLLVNVTVIWDKMEPGLQLILKEKCLIKDSGYENFTEAVF